MTPAEVQRHAIELANEIQKVALLEWEEFRSRGIAVNLEALTRDVWEDFQRRARAREG